MNESLKLLTPVKSVLIIKLTYLTCNWFLDLCSTYFSLKCTEVWHNRMTFMSDHNFVFNFFFFLVSSLSWDLRSIIYIFQSHLDTIYRPWSVGECDSCYIIVDGQFVIWFMYGCTYTISSQCNILENTIKQAMLVLFSFTQHVVSVKWASCYILVSCVQAIKQNMTMQANKRGKEIKVKFPFHAKDLWGMWRY